MKEDFQDRLDKAIDAALAAGDSREEILSTLELKVMALQEELAGLESGDYGDHDYGPD